MKTLYYLVIALRPHQWIKNIFVLIPLIFSKNFFYGPSLVLSFQAFIIFCTLASSTYLCNDISDIENDQNHPIKKHRPLVAGLISKRISIITATIFFLVSLAWAFLIGRLFFLTVLGYLIIQVFY